MPESSSSWVYVPGANVGLGATSRFTPATSSSTSFPFRSLGPPKVPLNVPWTDPNASKRTTVVSKPIDGLNRVSVTPNLQFRPELFPQEDDERPIITGRQVDIEAEACKEAEELISAMYAGLKEATAPRHRYKLPLDQPGTRLRLSTRPISSKPWSPQQEVFAARVIERGGGSGEAQENAQSSKSKTRRATTMSQIKALAPQPASFAAWIPSGSKFMAKQEAKTIREQPTDPKVSNLSTARRERVGQSEGFKKKNTTSQQHSGWKMTQSAQPNIAKDEDEAEDQDQYPKPSSRIAVTPLPPLPPAFDSLALKEKILAREMNEDDGMEISLSPMAPPPELGDDAETAKELQNSQSELLLPPIYIPSSIEHISPTKTADEDDDDDDLDLGPPQHSIIIVQSPAQTPKKAKRTPAKQHPPASPSVIVVTQSPGKSYVSDSLKNMHKPKLDQVKQVPIIIEEEDAGIEQASVQMPESERASRESAARHPPLDHYSKIFADLMELDPLLWPSPRPQPSPEKAVQTDEPYSPASSSVSIDSIADLAELEALVEKQHRQLIARGLLPPESKIKMPNPPPSSIFSGDSWESYEAGVKRLATATAGERGFSFH